MKRILMFVFVAVASAGVGWAGYRAALPPQTVLSKFVPAGPLVYLEAKDFSSMLSDWNSSAQKKQWIQSDNYQTFSRSRLFLRLKGAGDELAAAAGLPPDMDFLSQVAGQHSVLALYDIGELQFLYVTYLPSAMSMRNGLWQSRAKFEPRNAGGVDFYLRRDPESQRAVTFAIAGDYLLLATREDLMAGALELMSGKTDHTIETEQWWAQATTAAGQGGDLRMVLDMDKLVPNGYFRTYWVQQNITDLSQYSAAVSDLFRSGKQYREERVLIRKKEPEQTVSAAGLDAAADLSRLVPDEAGVYVSAANPSPDSCFEFLETKLLARRLGSIPASHVAPQVPLTSGEQRTRSDLETRIDVAPAGNEADSQGTPVLKRLLEKTPILASLKVQSSRRDKGGVFVGIRSAIVLKSASDWDAAALQSGITEFVRPGLTASQFGVGWMQETGYQQFDGLWPLSVSVRGKYVVVSDDPTLMEAVLANFNRNSDGKPLELLAGFNHDHERTNFARFAELVDRPNGGALKDSHRERQFFSGNIVSLSETTIDVSAERIEIRSEGNRLQQTVTYEWSR